VKRAKPSGAPWAPWASKLSSCRRRRHPSASHTTRQVLTVLARTTAHLRHQLRSLLFRCRACWPSNAGQAQCTEDSEDSDGTQDLHHSMRRLPKRISYTFVPAVSVTKPKPGSVDLASPPCSSSRLILQQPYATPDTRRMRHVRHDDQPSDIITPSKHGTEFSSILASVFVFFSSLLVYFL
jgi:hypothetical protein